MFSSWPLPLVFIVYFLLAACVVFFTIKASNHIDQIDKKTNIGSAVLGGILLAAITSLPELVTSISSVMGIGIESSPELAIGNIFGSNLFNMMILGIADIFFIHKTFLLHSDKGNRISNLLTLAMYVFLLVPIIIIRFFVGTTFTGIPHLWFSLLSVGIIIIYLINVFIGSKLRSDDEVLEEEADDSQSIKKHIGWFIFWSVLLVVTSILITNATDAINNALHLDSSFAGALFLGVATSLPELTSVLNLVRLNNYGAAIGDITGSSLFNITIISFVDLISYPTNLYGYVYSGNAENAIILLILGLISVLILVCMFLRRHCKNKIIYIIPSVLLVANYLVYIILSTI